MEYFQQLKTIFSGYGTPENVSQRYHLPPLETGFCALKPLTEDKL
ncbi:hypothetical protein T12_10077 [Trichinella patagoniensis]|uniref:Uncharacterized protein n=1 Tax=Trichinella patagoniensis TaxID=990121 RepID=A0A0V0YR55_9BILA|nr:hypothetical protein T12_12080 [Trichinella patagoniensis]KRY03462.1 hypothetical protein T12_10077 [Trichinella patagoniensis]